MFVSTVEKISAGLKVHLNRLRNINLDIGIGIDCRDPQA
jgi:hypothetical protein